MQPTPSDWLRRVPNAQCTRDSLRNAPDHYFCELAKTLSAVTNFQTGATRCVPRSLLTSVGRNGGVRTRGSCGRANSPAIAVLRPATTPASIPVLRGASPESSQCGAGRSGMWHQAAGARVSFWEGGIAPACPLLCPLPAAPGRASPGTSGRFSRACRTDPRVRDPRGVAQIGFASSRHDGQCLASQRGL